MYHNEKYELRGNERCEKSWVRAGRCRHIWTRQWPIQFGSKNLIIFASKMSISTWILRFDPMRWPLISYPFTYKITKWHPIVCQKKRRKCRVNGAIDDTNLIPIDVANVGKTDIVRRWWCDNRCRRSFIRSIATKIANAQKTNECLFYPIHSTSFCSSHAVMLSVISFDESSDVLIERVLSLPRCVQGSWWRKRRVRGWISMSFMRWNIKCVIKFSSTRHYSRIETSKSD